MNDLNDLFVKTDMSAIYPSNEINAPGFPESQLIWLTTPEKCAEIAAAFLQGNLSTLQVEEPLEEIVERLKKINGEVD